MRTIDRLDHIASSCHVPTGWMAQAARRPGSERHAVVQAVKMAVAAVVAWLVARQVAPNQSYFAPYAAIFVVDHTVLRSLLGTVRQLVALVLGLVLAVVVVQFVPNRYAALGAAVLLGGLMGEWTRLRDSGIGIPVTAVLAIATGAVEEVGDLVVRGEESVIGVAIGTAVNVLVVPPVHLSDARRAVRLLSSETAALLRSFADQLEGTEQPDDESPWLRRAQELERSADRAHETADFASEGTKLNPRWLWWRLRYRTMAPAQYASATRTLHRVAREMQHLCEIATWATDHSDGLTAAGSVDHETVDLLRAIADVVTDYDAAIEDGCQGEPLDRLQAMIDDVACRRGRIATRHGAAAEGDDGSPATPDVERRIAELMLLITVERTARLVIDESRQRPHAQEPVRVASIRFGG